MEQEILSAAPLSPSQSHDDDPRVHRRARQALKILKTSGRDVFTIRKYAAAARSWCQMHPSMKSHSRREGGATHRMWRQVERMCDDAEDV
jgi:hypothetical protein